jgi:Uma2 family endonuclease
MITTIKTLSPPLTFQQFLENLPDEEGRYELVNGQIMRILATRRHEDLADRVTDILREETKQKKLNYRVSGRIVVRTETAAGQEQGRHPDVTVVDKTQWEAQPSAYSALVDPPQLLVEIVSTNWEDDYVDKFEEYQRLGVPEYWIVDYWAIASRSYLGNPKDPTLFVCILNENQQYEMKGYKLDDPIVSVSFPELRVTPEQIWSI